MLSMDPEQAVHIYYGSTELSCFQHNHLTFTVEKGILRPEKIILGTPGITHDWITKKKVGHY